MIKYVTKGIIIMSIASNVYKEIEIIPRGQVFCVDSLRTISTAENLRKIISRLNKAGVIKKITNGVFVKPKVVKNKTIIPTGNEVIKSIAERTGEKIIIHGAEAARLLGISTQMSLNSVYYTTGRTREIKATKQIIKLIHINPRLFSSSNETVNLVISAIYYLTRSNFNLNTIEQIKAMIPDSEFEALIWFIHKMPVWMRNVFIKYLNKGG